MRIYVKRRISVQAVRDCGSDADRTTRFGALLKNTAALGVIHFNKAAVLPTTLLGFVDVVCATLREGIDGGTLPGRIPGGCTFSLMLQELEQAPAAVVDSLLCATGLPFLQLAYKGLSICTACSELARRAQTAIAALLVYQGHANRAAFEQIGGTRFFQELSCAVAEKSVALRAAELVLTRLRERDTALYNQRLRRVLRDAQLKSDRLILSEPLRLCASMVID